MKTLILSLALLATSAQAEFISGNKLYSQMSGTEGDRMMALGFVAGVHDAIDTVLVCTPNAITIGQVRDMTSSYLSENPSIRHLSASAIVTYVLSKAWPCKKGTSL
jgi:hypothetical protein